MKLLTFSFWPEETRDVCSIKLHSIWSLVLQMRPFEPENRKNPIRRGVKTHICRISHTRIVSCNYLNLQNSTIIYNPLYRFLPSSEGFGMKLDFVVKPCKTLRCRVQTIPAAPPSEVPLPQPLLLGGSDSHTGSSPANRALEHSTDTRSCLLSLIREMWFWLRGMTMIVWGVYRVCTGCVQCAVYSGRES